MPQVSIHAPVKGATPKVLLICSTEVCFNPRAREGRDSNATRDGWAGSGFNPRAREGRDAAYRLELPYTALGFNPRAREGRDLRLSKSNATLIHVSIHAPVKGATFYDLTIVSSTFLFQSTRP